MKRCSRSELLLLGVCRHRWCRAENERGCPHGRREPKSALNTIKQNRKSQIIRLGVKRGHVALYSIPEGRRQKVNNKPKQTNIRNDGLSKSLGRDIMSHDRASQAI